MELWNLELLLPLLLPLLLLLLLLWLPLLSPMRLAKSDPTPNQQNPTKANVRKMIKISADTGLEGLHAKRVCPSAWWAVAPAPVPPENLHDGHRECSADKFEHSIVGTENVENVGKTHLWARRMLRMLAKLNCGHIEC